MPFCCVNGCPNQTKPGYDKNYLLSYTAKRRIDSKGVDC